MAILSGIDFFTVEVLTWRGLATYYVLFFLHLETRRVTLAGITRHPTEDWMVQMARRAVDPIDGALLSIRFVRKRQTNPGQRGEADQRAGVRVATSESVRRFIPGSMSAR